MMKMLDAKTAVITGGSSGIGREMALSMAQMGANIAVVYFPPAQCDAAKEVKAAAEKCGVRAEVYECDVSNFELVKETCDKIASDFDGVDILVNNAGITKDNLLLRMGETDFDAVISVNLKGAFNMTKHIARYIMKSPAGRIINIASVSGLMGNAGQANYAAAKAGMVGLTKTVAKELAGRGVTCNAIAPGFIETAMTEVLPDSVKEYVKGAVPLKRMGKVDEVTNLALFLASDMSSYITGEVIRVDGGLCM